MVLVPLSADQVGLVSAQIDENVYREIINHRSLRHPNIIQFIEVRARSRYFSIVYYSFLSFIIFTRFVLWGLKKTCFMGLVPCTCSRVNRRGHGYRGNFDEGGLSARFIVFIAIW